MKKKILVIDDERSILELLRIKLEKKGFEVITALNAAEGTALAFSEKPDLLILDIWLGNNGGGTQLYDDLLDSGFSAQIPVVFISALVDKDTAPQMPSEGTKYVLFGKPFDFDLMLREIYRLVDLKKDQDQDELRHV